VEVAFDGGFLFGEFDAGEFAEEEVGVALERGEKLLVLGDVVLGLLALLVGLGVEVGFEVLESGCELVAGQHALDLPVLDELEVGVRFHQLLQLGLSALAFACCLPLAFACCSAPAFHRGGLLTFVVLHRLYIID
jgi:hypothetical protein